MGRSNDRGKFRDRDQTIEMDRSIEIDQTIAGVNHRSNDQTKSIKRSIDCWTNQEKLKSKREKRVAINGPRLN